MAGSGTVRWGILSTARINQELIPGFVKSATSDLVAVASRSPEHAAAYAADNCIPVHFGSYEDLLASREIECVYISLPNGLHAEWIRKSLQAGKHVLCEKPLTATSEDARWLYAMAHSRGLVLSEAVMYRHHPQTRRLKEMVDAGEIGELRHLHASFHFRLSDRAGEIRLDPNLAGGALRDVGVYCVSLGNLLAGDAPEEVAGTHVTSGTGVDMRFYGTLTYASDFVTQFDCSMDTSTHVRATVLGETGWISTPNPWYLDVGGPWLPAEPPMFLEIHRPSQETEVVGTTSVNAYLCEIDDFAVAVRGGDAFLVPPAETVRNLTTIERLLASARATPNGWKET